MTENINKLIKLVKRNGVIVSHRMANPKIKVNEYRCSTYIEKEKILVKGEDYDKNESETVFLAFFDLETGKLISMY